MNKYIKALVKVTSQYEYAQNFRDGKLWMNELRFFTKCEQKELGDAKEARGTTFSFLNHTYHLINNQDLCRPIFCLYGVYDTKHGNTSFISIPEKMKAFGTYAVVVTDVEEFLNRLRRVPLIFSPSIIKNLIYTIRIPKHRSDHISIKESTLSTNRNFEFWMIEFILLKIVHRSMNH